MDNNNIKFVFFGSSRFSVIVLDVLVIKGFIPCTIVTTPDKPQGRKMQITPNPVKLWAQKKGIKCFSPAQLNPEFCAELAKENGEVFIVASYGKIMPDALLKIPPRSCLNIHPSLLPQYRGASPLQTTILDDIKKTGVTIIEMDKEMDHGPIVAFREIVVQEWPVYDDFEKDMAITGAELLANIFPLWISGGVKTKEQDHSKASFTRKIAKEDGLMDPNDDAYSNFRKIQAFMTWPKAYFMHTKHSKTIRVKISEATWKDGNIIIKKVIPEGKKEMSYDDFIRGYGRSDSTQG